MLKIAIYGHKNSGKTALITSLVEKLSKKGFKIAVIKHIHHSKFEVDIEGKDTWRHRRAGASFVAGITKNTLYMLDEGVEEAGESLEFVLDYLSSRGKTDIVFLEGFKELTQERKDIYKIALLKEGEKQEDLLPKPVEGLLGVYNFNTTKEKERIVEELLEKILKLKKRKIIP